MPSDAAIRASARIRARLGLGSTLDGVDCGPVHIEHGVRLLDGEVSVLRSVATIGKEYRPATNKTLVHPTEGTLVLDALVGDNGASRRYVVRPG